MTEFEKVLDQLDQIIEQIDTINNTLKEGLK